MDWFSETGRALQEGLGDFYTPVMAVLKILAILLAAFLFARLVKLGLAKLFARRSANRAGMDLKRVDTIQTLLSSVVRYVIYIIAGVAILTDVFQLTSVLAAAGIGGVALGFGAQSLIKDIISGFFIVFEDQFAVGDLVTIEDLSGTVENMELRVTKIRSSDGDLYIIPNGEIKRVINHTRGNKAVVVNIPVAYGSDVSEALEAAGRACKTAAGEFSTLVEEPKVLGITNLEREGLVLTITGKTLANEQWAVERRIRLLVREEFGRKDIEFYDKDRVIADKSKG